MERRIEKPQEGLKNPPSLKVLAKRAMDKLFYIARKNGPPRSQENDSSNAKEDGPPEAKEYYPPKAKEDDKNRALDDDLPRMQDGPPKVVETDSEDGPPKVVETDSEVLDCAAENGQNEVEKADFPGTEDVDERHGPPSDIKVDVAEKSAGPSDTKDGNEQREEPTDIEVEVAEKSAGPSGAKENGEVTAVKVSVISFARMEEAARVSTDDPKLLKQSGSKNNETTSKKKKLRKKLYKQQDKEVENLKNELEYIEGGIKNTDEKAVQAKPTFKKCATQTTYKKHFDKCTQTTVCSKTQYSEAKTEACATAAESGQGAASKEMTITDFEMELIASHEAALEKGDASEETTEVGVVKEYYSTFCAALDESDASKETIEYDFEKECIPTTEVTAKKPGEPMKWFKDTCNKLNTLAKGLLKDLKEAILALTESHPQEIEACLAFTQNVIEQAITIETSLRMYTATCSDEAIQKELYAMCEKFHTMYVLTKMQIRVAKSFRSSRRYNDEEEDRQLMANIAPTVENLVKVLRDILDYCDVLATRMKYKWST